MEQDERSRDEQLIKFAQMVPGGSDSISRGAFAQLIVILKDAMVGEQKVTTALTERIRKLTVLLVWFTVAIFALTIVMILLGLNILRPLP